VLIQSSNNWIDGLHLRDVGIKEGWRGRGLDGRSRDKGQERYDVEEVGWEGWRKRGTMGRRRDGWDEKGWSGWIEIKWRRRAGGEKEALCGREENSWRGGGGLEGRRRDEGVEKGWRSGGGGGGLEQLTIICLSCLHRTWNRGVVPGKIVILLPTYPSMQV
jgi:hypothetical protein